MNRHIGLFVSALLLPTLVAAQPKLRVPAQPACAGCSVESKRLFTVGAIPGATTGRDSHVARDSSGRYLVVVEPGPRVAVIDSTGKFIEFLDLKSSRTDSSARNTAIRVDADGLPSLFDGESWISRQNTQLYGKPRIGLIDNYRVVAQMHVMGLPVATTRPASGPHRTFGTTKLRYDPFDIGERSMLDSDNMRVATARQQFEIDSVVSNPACRDCSDLVVEVPTGFAKGAVWTATVDRYRINIYQSWGDLLLAAVEVSNAWLPLNPNAAPGRTLPEAPRMTGLYYDQRTCKDRSEPAMNFSDPRRKEACERGLWVAGLTMADSTARDDQQRYATVIDVLGLSGRYVPQPGTPLDSARVLTRTKLPGRVELFGAGLAYQRRVLPNGQWALDVYRLSVVGR